MKKMKGMEERDGYYSFEVRYGINVSGMAFLFFSAYSEEG